MAKNELRSAFYENLYDRYELILDLKRLSFHNETVLNMKLCVTWSPKKGTEKESWLFVRINFTWCVLVMTVWAGATKEFNVYHLDIWYGNRDRLVKSLQRFFCEIRFAMCKIINVLQACKNSFEFSRT